MNKAIVRPDLEYCIQAWRPYRRKDICLCLQQLQRRETKLNPGLEECGLTTLETRRLMGDQIEVFQILNGHEHIQ